MRALKTHFCMVGFGLVLATSPLTSLADVASRVLESGSTTHRGVLAYVRDASHQGRKIEHAFFGEGLGKVRTVAPDFQIQIVEREDIPGGALPGSFVILTPSGERVISMQRGYNKLGDLRALVGASSAALDRASSDSIAFFEYDR